MGIYIYISTDFLLSLDDFYFVYIKLVIPVEHHLIPL